MNVIPARFQNLSTTNLNQKQKHYHIISKTADFTNKNNGTENITEETFLITLDVKSLYSKIPNHGDIEAAKEALNSVPKKPIATKIIIKFLFLILTLNNFIFNGIYYLQKLWFAMRTIFLWEKLKETSYIHVLKHFKILSIYRWYIFTLGWNGKSINTSLNSNRSTIKLILNTHNPTSSF